MPIMRDPARSAAGTFGPNPGATQAPCWYVGVDGGATRCRARIRDARGSVLAEAEGDAANIHVDFASAVAVMRSVVGEVLRKAGIGRAADSASRSGSGLPNSATRPTRPPS